MSMDMKKLMGPICVAMSIIVSSESKATSFNGSFETGALDGWTVSIDLTLYDDGEVIHATDPPFPIFDQLPFLNPVVTDENYFEAMHGDRYLEIPGNYGIRNLGIYQTEGIGTISVSQEITLRAGSMIAGYAALYTTDYPPYNADNAFVTVASDLVYDQPVQITVKDAYGDAWYTGGADPQRSPWVYWTWTAPKTDRYTLSLNNHMDDQEESVAAFDDIQVYRTVPEAPTALLMGVALTLLLGFRKRLRSGQPA